jgi:hypothetical protein
VTTVTREAQFFRCDRCGREEPYDRCHPARRVVICATRQGGRSIDLCAACHEDVLRFCEGLDGPFARIEMAEDGRPQRSGTRF